MSELLTWDGEDLDGCIVCEDLAVLRNFATRGGNLVMPGANGSRPYAPVLDQLDTTLTFAVTGRFDSDGSPHADREVGVEQNLEHYRDLFTTGGDPDTGEHDISLSFAGSAFTGAVQVWEYAQARTGPTTAKILVRVTVAAGALTETGS